MNLVTETPQLFDAAAVDAALARLGGLFEIMLRQPGFLRAEVLRSLGDPRKLLVLHAWRDLADWQRFQTSETKIAFTQGRPAALYEFLPCPMNWLTPDDPGEPAAPILRRELVHADEVAILGGGAAGSVVYTCQDEAPEYQGLAMRLTRYSATSGFAPAADAGVVADETFESLVRRSAAGDAAAASR